MDGLGRALGAFLTGVAFLNGHIHENGPAWAGAARPIHAPNNSATNHR
jgi:hypothetical protein